MTAVQQEFEQQKTRNRWVTLAVLSVSAGAFVTRARKAKGSSDLLVHADVIVALAGLLVVIAQTRRNLRGKGPLDAGPVAGEQS